MNSLKAMDTMQESAEQYFKRRREQYLSDIVAAMEEEAMARFAAVASVYCSGFMLMGYFFEKPTEDNFKSAKQNLKRIKEMHQVLDDKLKFIEEEREKPVPSFNHKMIIALNSIIHDCIENLEPLFQQEELPQPISPCYEGYFKIGCRVAKGFVDICSNYREVLNAAGVQEIHKR